MRFIRTISLAITMLTLVQASATAGVIIGGTRIIFDGAKKKRQSALIILMRHLI